MKIPQLSKKPELKSCHNEKWEDSYSWVHQSNILEVLRDNSKLLTEVREYLEKENEYFENEMKDTKKIQKKLFDEIKGRIKLDDDSLPFKDKNYEYWSKTTAQGNYSIKLRKKIGTNNVEEIWNGDKEKEKLGVEYFGVGDLEVSHDDKFLAYSLDLDPEEIINSKDEAEIHAKIIGYQNVNQGTSPQAIDPSQLAGMGQPAGVSPEGAGPNSTGNGEIPGGSDNPPMPGEMEFSGTTQEPS